MIHVESCTIKKGTQFTLEVEDLSFHIGRKHFIIGASGSGKSTLIKALLGLHKCKGMIHKVQEERRIPVDSPEYKKGLMYLSQDFALWEHLSVEQHLNFTLSQGKSLQKHPETEYYMALVGLVVQSAQKPDMLSGGEKQRLALARALAAKPEYLFLDEPFANIDIVQANALMHMLEKEHKKEGFGLIKITHHFVGIKDIHSMIIVLEEGRVTFQGTYQQMDKKSLSPWIQKWKELLP